MTGALASRGDHVDVGGDRLVVQRVELADELGGVPLQRAEVLVDAGAEPGTPGRGGLHLPAETGNPAPQLRRPVDDVAEVAEDLIGEPLDGADDGGSALR